MAWLISTSPSFAGAGEELESQAQMDAFSLRLGSYLLDSSTRARVDGIGGNFGTRFDFEDDLNLQKRKDAMLAAIRWRFRERHFVEIEHFSLKRYGTKRIDKEIEFGDSVFAVGADVSSSFTTEVTRLGYAYRAVRRPDWGLALSAGLHVTRLRASLDAVVFDSGNIPAIQYEIASVSAPLPVVGFNAARRLGDNWTLVGKAQWFYLEYDDVDGSIGHAATLLEYKPFEHFGFGFGYDWFDVNVDSTETNWRGSADVSFDGPIVFVQISF